MISIQDRKMTQRNVFLFLALSALVLGQNLLVNGDFESGEIKGRFTNGYPDGWGGWGVNGWHHSDVGYRLDNYGIAIWDNDTGCIQVISVSGGNQFEVSGRMIYHTTEVLVNKNALLKIEFWDGPDPSGSKLMETNIGVLTPAHTAGAWYSFSDTVTAPAGTTEARIICQTVSTGSSSTGKAFWDNLSVDNMQQINDPDYDGDHHVNYIDFSMLAGVWQEDFGQYNLSGDNFIDLEDLVVMAESWLPTVPSYPGYTFVWSDEFEGPDIDLANWTFEIGTGSGGWGNWEWEYYTSRPENARIVDGKLVIEARQESYGGKDYTSARLKTQGKRSFQYGRIEARIKMPIGGEGIWPAFWMLGTNYSSVGWPTCGEIDIVEMMSNPYTALGTIHYGNPSGDHASQGGENNTGGNLSDDFHIYAIEWDQTGIRWYRDSNNYFTASYWTSNAGPFPAPFNQPFFIILNFAVGAWWWEEDPSVPFPQQLTVDYVRVYEKNP